MQKSIILHLLSGETICIGIDRFISAEPGGDISGGTDVSYEGFDEDYITVVTESPEAINKLINTAY